MIDQERYETFKLTLNLPSLSAFDAKIDLLSGYLTNSFRKESKSFVLGKSPRVSISYYPRRRMLYSHPSHPSYFPPYVSHMFVILMVPSWRNFNLIRVTRVIWSIKIKWRRAYQLCQFQQWKYAKINISSSKILLYCDRTIILAINLRLCRGGDKEAHLFRKTFIRAWFESHKLITQAKDMSWVPAFPRERIEVPGSQKL